MNSSFMKWRIKRRFLPTGSESWIASRGMTALGVVALTLCALGTCFLPSANAQVTQQRLVDSAKEPQNWLMYSGNYGGHRFSALDQINTSNAAALVPKWAYQTMAGGKFETTPLVVDGIRGFIDAYDTATGERKWRFYTTPGPGEPGHESWEGDSWKIGGAPAWITGTYDPATNTTFWTTGNPSPSNRGEGRAGDNLYSNSLLALDPDTGKLKWYFQFTKHDEHDYDATQVPVVVDQGEKHFILQ